MAAESETSFVVAYPCPHCQAALEVRAGRATAWLRCPNCGRAGRVPVGKRVAVREAVTTRDDLIFIDAVPDPNPPTPAALAWNFTTPERAAAPVSAWRVVCATALFVSVTLSLFALLEGSTYSATVFISAAIISLGLLIRAGRS